MPAWHGLARLHLSNAYRFPHFEDEVTAETDSSVNTSLPFTIVVLRTNAAHAASLAKGFPGQ
jgi:hypothetical protein